MIISIIPEMGIVNLRTEYDRTEKYILISISCDRDYIFNFEARGNFLGYVEVDFDDIELSTYENFAREFPDKAKRITLMKEYQADKIVDLVVKHKDNIEKIVIHCAAGVSRSAGVGKALAEWLNGTDEGVINPKLHIPNMYCYDKMMAAIQKYETAVNSK